MQSRPQIVIAKTEPEKADVYRFRYRVQVEQLGRAPAGADADAKTVREPLDDAGLHMCMTIDETVVASVRLNLLRISPIAPDMSAAYALDKFMDFAPEALSITAQPIVDEKWSSSNLPAVLLGATYKLARRQGVRIDFCHCLPNQLSFYENLGYRRYAEGFTGEGSVQYLPMVLLTEDLEYLRECDSPFVKMAVGLSNSNKTALWFRRTFPDYANHTPRQRMSEEDFWNLLTQKLQQTPLESVPLLKGLAYEDARWFVNLGTIIEARDGDAISGGGSGELNVLLSGGAALRAKMADGAAVTLDTYKRGDAFCMEGSLDALPKGAGMVATSQSEILALSDGDVARAMADRPRAAAALMMNLSQIYCGRLRTVRQDRLAEPATKRDPAMEEPTVQEEPTVEGSTEHAA